MAIVDTQDDVDDEDNKIEDCCFVADKLKPKCLKSNVCSKDSNKIDSRQPAMRQTTTNKLAKSNLLLFGGNSQLPRLLLAVWRFRSRLVNFRTAKIALFIT